ncbi:hypothetical protein [Sulfurimonas indica]|uniref:hypothetical protein n=1 Tax=Sulfurimonas TaxID=202746 RepID=UPI0012658AAE|nr:hypothetical protein [Sulfurimonas indica]
MINLYHVSNPIFRKKILREGLLPKVGDSYIAHYEEKNIGPVIFVSTQNDYDSTYDDDRYLISLSDEEFKVLEFKIDNEVQNGLYTRHPIAKEKLELVHSGTGKSLF